MRLYRQGCIDRVHGQALCRTAQAGWKMRDVMEINEMRPATFLSVMG